MRSPLSQHVHRRDRHGRLALPAVLLVVLWAGGAAASDEDKAPGELLPWASDQSEASQGGLTVRAGKQLVGTYRREMTGFRFEVENTTDAPRTFRATGLEVLSAWSNWPPPAPGESRDRDPKVRKLVIRGCWYEDAAHKITEVRRAGRGPVTVSVPPKSTLRVMLRFAPVKRAGGHAHWRRLTFTAGGPPLKVTGPIVPIRFSEDSIQGELVKP